MKDDTREFGTWEELADDAPAEAAAGGDLFYRGTLIRFWHGAGAGVVRTGSGREIPFEIEHVTVLGSLVTGPGRYALEQGMRVGFDVGWTSRGLRVTKLFPAE